jgi:hypothetical protein
LFAAMAELEPHLNKTEARAGTTPHVARVVLVVGTLLTIIAFAIILFIYG